MVVLHPAHGTSMGMEVEEVEVEVEVADEVEGNFGPELDSIHRCVAQVDHKLEYNIQMQLCQTGGESEQ